MYPNDVKAMFSVKYKIYQLQNTDLKNKRRIIIHLFGLVLF